MFTDRLASTFYALSPRAKKKIIESTNEEWFISHFHVLVDDGYYYCKMTESILYENIDKLHKFDGFKDLYDYIRIYWYIRNREDNELVEILEKTNLDLSIDDNRFILDCIYEDKYNSIKVLLKNPKVDIYDRFYIVCSKYRNIETIKVLLEDGRVNLQTLLEFYACYTDRKDIINEILRYNLKSCNRLDINSVINDVVSIRVPNNPKTEILNMLIVHKNHLFVNDLKNKYKVIKMYLLQKIKYFF